VIFFYNFFAICSTILKKRCLRGPLKVNYVIHTLHVHYIYKKNRHVKVNYSIFASSKDRAKSQGSNTILDFYIESFSCNGLVREGIPLINYELITHLILGFLLD
jgi:hypothetical protein